MATLDQNQERKKKISQKALIRILLVLAILLVIGAVIYLVSVLYRNNYGTFGGYEVVETVERNDGSSTNYISYNELLLKYSRDGVTAMNESGDFLWNGSYEMKDPIVDSCGGYVAVADRDNKLVHIYGENGPVGDITVDYPILAVQVSNQGNIAVMMEEGNRAYVYLYKSNGTLIGSIDKAIVEAGFPLSMALSNDGSRIVLSFLDTSAGAIATNIACYSFTEVGRNEINNFVGGNIVEGQVVAKVDYITNNIVCLYRDQGFTLYSMKQKLAESPIVEEEFETPIRSIVSSDSYVGFVLEAGETDTDKYKLVVYDTKGNKVLEQGINFEYSSIEMKGSEILLYNYMECMVINTRGTVRFEHQFEESIDAMFAASKNKFYIVRGDKIEVVRLKGAK